MVFGAPHLIYDVCTAVRDTGSQKSAYEIEVDHSYGVKGLPSYDDQNALFRDARTGQEYVLKVHNLNANCQSESILDAQV